MNVTDEAARQALVDRFKALTQVDLPDRARADGWPLRLDHCFKRVCLDWAFRDCWYRHLKRPAEQHIGGADLDRAVRCAEEILDGGVALLKKRNAASLRWRGKSSAVPWRASETLSEGPQ